MRWVALSFSSVAPLKGVDVVDGIQTLATLITVEYESAIIRNLPSEKAGRGLTDSGLIVALFKIRAWMKAMPFVQQQPITSQGIGGGGCPECLTAAQ